jgi:transglutaminase-like putative cysteine protease
MWTDAAGEVLKTYTPGVEQATYRVTREVALAAPTAAPIDLLKVTTVRVAALIPDAHRRTMARYQVTLDNGNPAQTFASGGTQEVRSTGPNIAEITVRSLSPEALPSGPATAAEPPPTDADRRPTIMLQSDDPQVMALAKEAAGDERDPAKLAVRLESFVYTQMRKKDFTQALATAAEVAHSLQGDCTEHAVLLAALCRARGLPARVAVGLVYVPQASGFLFHMWTEAYLNGRWVPLDGTLGQGGIGVAHLKVTHSSLDGADAIATLLPVAQVMGRLKIEVLEVE